MLITLGYASLLFAFFTSIYGVFALLIGVLRHDESWIESGEKACQLLFPLLTLSIGALLALLLQRQYQVDYVHQTVDNFQPLYLQITAIWGKQSGSLLFWSWLYAFFMLIWLKTFAKKNPDLFPTAGLLLLLHGAFFLALNIWVENPFHRLWINVVSGTIIPSVFPVYNFAPFIAQNGLGMNPLLRHYGMVYHPPTLYLGYISIFFPGVSQISAMIHRPDSFQWVRQLRSWNLFAWVFLAIGLILGSRWAYDVLGWGGYWGWDPVEVSALLPFILLTAYLHSAFLLERFGRFKAWTVISGLLSLLSIAFSTFVTRSGLIASVHAFSASPLSNWLTGYMAIFTIIILALITLRWKTFQTKNDTSSPFISRNTVLTGTLIILYLIACFCLWGILLPNISALFSEFPITIGKNFYTTSTGPLFLLLILGMGCYPLLSWGKQKDKMNHTFLIVIPVTAAVLTTILAWIQRITSPLTIITIFAIIFALISFLVHMILHPPKTRQRIAFELIHLGIILMTIGIIGIEFFQTEMKVKLAVNDSVNTAGGYIVRFDALDETEISEGTLSRATITVERNSIPLAKAFPERKFYAAYQQETTHPGLYSTLMDDLYIILHNKQTMDPNEPRLFTIFHNPLVNWLWIGSILLCFGGAAAWFNSLRNKGKAKQ